MNNKAFKKLTPAEKDAPAAAEKAAEEDAAESAAEEHNGDSGA